LAAFANQDVPFERLVEDLNPDRDLSRTPIFQTSFTLQSGTGDEFLLPGIRVEEIPLSDVIARFDLECSLRPQPDGSLTGAMVYSADLFDQATVNRIAAALSTVLHSFTSEREQRLSEIELTTHQERQRVQRWNDTAVEIPTKTVSELFEEQARRTPSAPALLTRAGNLSYSELEGRASRLSRYLRSLGIGPESLVGVCLERSSELVVSLLGILKSGAAYLPIDAENPRERIAFMLKEGNVEVVLTREELAARVPISDGRSVCLDRDLELIETYSAEPLPPLGRQANRAYVMYTSGSTGVPKGIEVTHRNIVRLVSKSRYARLAAGEVMLQFGPIAFDASTFEIWGPLINGGSVAIVDEADLDAIGVRLDEFSVTGAFLTTGLFNTIVDRNPKLLAGLQQLLVGGETLSPPHIAKALSALPTLRLTSCYGPTETTTFATTQRIVSSDGSSPIPIGFPIMNTTAYVVDPDLNLVPIGVAGELLIGGAGVARGYLNRPALTAERFIPDSLANDGSRLYRSGDQVRRRSDGAIEFIGRFDDQVKIRGFRIEPGEVQAVIRQHPAVRDAAVVVHEERPGDKRLVAYVAADGVDKDELREFSEERLPGYATPSIVVLAELPLNRNGKLDRTALPVSGDIAASQYSPPRTPVEEMICRLFADATGMQPVGISDNFFELGGHSLTAMQVVSRIRRVFGIELPAAAIFERPTVIALAESVAAAEPARHTASLEGEALLLNDADPGATPIFALHMAGGGVGQYLPLGIRLQPDVAVIGVIDAAEHSPTSIEELAARHAETIITAQPDGPINLIGYSFSGPLAFEVAQALKARGRPARKLLLVDPAPFELADENPERLQYVRAATAESAPDAVSERWLAHVDALLSYRPRRFEGQAVLLLSDAHHHDEWREAWEAVIAEPSVEYVPGDHHDVAEEPHVEALAAAVRRALE
jgi:amino acid adenylation domain-containing protein